jgi:hypothetical protein
MGSNEAGNGTDIIWVGVLETCDCCHDVFPMSWIIYTGKQFLCYACYYPDGRACRLSRGAWPFG